MRQRHGRCKGYAALRARVWLLESPNVTVDLVTKDLGWSMLNQDVVAEKFATGELVQLQLAFEKADIL